MAHLPDQTATLALMIGHYPRQYRHDVLARRLRQSVPGGLPGSNLSPQIEKIELIQSLAAASDVFRARRGEAMRRGHCIGKRATRPRADGK